MCFSVLVMSLLYESKDIGPRPCMSPNLVLDFHICLNNPLNRCITTRYGIKKNLFCEEWQNNMTMEIGTRWNSLIPSVQFKWKLYKYITIICLILCISIPIILYFFANFKLFKLIVVGGINVICFLMIGIISTWFWLYGVTKKFRKQFVKKILKNYVNELPLRYEHLSFTLLYPVIFYLTQNKENNNNPIKQIYCVLRISDGIVYCDDQGLEPLYFTTSEMMKEIHSKYKISCNISNNSNHDDDNDKNKNEYYESGLSYTPRSDTNPPILHQMKPDNRKQYDSTPYNNNCQINTPIVNKFNFNEGNIQAVNNKNIL